MTGGFIFLSGIEFFLSPENLRSPALHDQSEFEGVSARYVDDSLNRLVFGVGFIFSLASHFPCGLYGRNFFEPMLRKPLIDIFSGFFADVPELGADLYVEYLAQCFSPQIGFGIQAYGLVYNTQEEN